MDHDTYQRAARLFDEAMGLPPEERDGHVARGAAGDAVLERRVRRMVAFAGRPGSTGPLVLGVAGGPGPATDPAADADLSGSQIGPYRIVRRIGAGGFGSVYQAEQERPVRRTVALKLLRGGIDSHQIIARFEAERQALALMEHPGIARVIDAGQTDAAAGSRPYFAMELVPGVPITEHCDRARLGWRERIELFIAVCRAVQHAHHKGIIHRDLKPSNILVSEVDGAAAPKVIDFGIAKALREPLTDTRLVTSRMELLGTPQYMSPEQADAGERAIDTRTDVFSLGVVLYELLTGTTPLDAEALSTAPYSRVLRLIVDQQVDRPSTRLARLDGDAARVVAARLGTDAATLRRRLRGDLDWIILKALDRERERRYASADALAEDLRRHLRHEPVLAGPPAAAYRAAKFVRRHRVGVAAAAVVGVTLVAGAVVMVAAALRVRDSARQAQAVNQFMSDVLTSANPQERGADVRLAEVLGDASATAAQRFAGHPELEAQVRDLLGRVYLSLGLKVEASTQFKLAGALLLEHLGPADRRTLEVRLMHAQALLHRELPRETEVLLTELVPHVERLAPEDPLVFRARWITSGMHSLRGRSSEAERMLRDLRAGAAAGDDAQHVMILDALIPALRRQLGGDPERDQRRRAEIEALAREMSERAVRAHGRESFHALRADVLVADMLWRRGAAAEAADVCRTALAGSRERLGECQPQRVLAMDVLSRALLELGDCGAAAELERQAMGCARARGPSIELLVRVFDAMLPMDCAGHWAEGEALAREYATLLEGLGGGHGDARIQGDLYLARFTSLQGRHDEADALFAALLAREAETAPGSRVRARLHLFHGCHLTARGAYEAAELELLAAAGQLADLSRGTSDGNPGDLVGALVDLYERWGKPERAREYRALRHAEQGPQEGRGDAGAAGHADGHAHGDGDGQEGGPAEVHGTVAK
jgi:serine/threonine protein kinase